MVELGRPSFKNKNDVRSLVMRMSKNEILIILTILEDINENEFGVNEWNRSRVSEIYDRFSLLREKVD